MDDKQLKQDLVRAIKNQNEEYVEHYLSLYLDEHKEQDKQSFFQSVVNELELDKNPNLNDWLSRVIAKLKVTQSSFKNMKKEFTSTIVAIAEYCGYIQERDFDVFEEGIAFKNKEMIYDISRYFNPLFQKSLLNSMEDV